MAFRKFAQATVLGAATSASGGRLAKVAQLEGGPRSYYLDGSRQIPVSDMLERVAAAYSISADPKDYLFEAIRANTTNAPNENHDGFERSELLRFDTRLGMPVFRTYESKPHHVNHKTDNPHAARGLILDAHYNDDAPPLETCPTCDLDTKHRANRDASGLHCRRCTALLKDEFVEILLGVDTKKDPVFARGVQAGQLNAGSMGCNCLNTSCNVCRHIAYSRPEFCEHIKSGSKGSLWQKQAGASVWTKTQPIEVERQLKRRGLCWNPTDFCAITAADGFEVRKAYEYCQQVVFDEYSRVDQPADPKARSREILRTASVAVPANLMPSPAELRRESEALIREATMRRSATSNQRRAGRFMVICVDGDPADIHAGASLEEALAAAGLNEADPESVNVSGMEVEADDPESALSQFDPEQAQPIDQLVYPAGGDDGLDAPGLDVESDVTVQAPPNESVVIEPSGGPGEGGEPGAPGPQSIDQLQDEGGPGGPPPAPGGPPGAPPAGPGRPPGQLSPADMGMVPPGAGKQGSMRFKSAYSQWTVEVSPAGNARVFTAKKQPILVIRGAAEPDPAKRRAFGTRVLRALFTDGLVKTATAFKGVYTPRIAQVVDGAIDDMKEFADKNMHSSVIEDELHDFTDARQTPPDHVPDAFLDDIDGDLRGAPISNTQDDGLVDHAEGAPAGVEAVTGGDSTDMRDTKRPKVNIGSDTVLKNEMHDHAEKIARLTRQGARIVHIQRPNEAWAVTGRKRAADASEMATFGKLSFIVERGQRGKVGHTARRVAARDLVAYWKSLDQPIAPRRAAPVAVQAAAAPAVDLGAYEARMKKAWKLEKAKLERTHAEALEQTRQATVGAFCRALRIVATRQAADLEASPIRQAAEQLRGTPRQVGIDAATGNQNDWAGQVDPLWKGTYKIPCPWMLQGKAFVYSSGKVGHCCLDASGAGAIGHVDDDIGSLKLTGWKLCATCYQEYGQDRS